MKRLEEVKRYNGIDITKAALDVFIRNWRRINFIPSWRGRNAGVSQAPERLTW